MQRCMVIRRKKLYMFLIATFIILILTTLIYRVVAKNKTSRFVMGGHLYVQEIDTGRHTLTIKEMDVEKYFRPSKLPVLNNRMLTTRDLFDWSYQEEPNKFILPNELNQTPEDTLLNYYSVLREAANYKADTKPGCGSLGNGKLPYPIAYNFLSSDYKKRVSYNEYMDSFKNILHINLIKYQEIPTDMEHSKDIKYFVEIETIEGSEKDVTYFAYYYGYLYMTKENNRYYISDMIFTGENYLCAPYHGWNYIAEAVVDIKYGNWCSLVKERYPTEQEGYVKKVYFSGTDGNEYLIVFFQLTNDTDIEIAQFIKNEDGTWEHIFLDPLKCLDTT